MAFLREFLKMADIGLDIKCYLKPERSTEAIKESNNFGKRCSEVDLNEIQSTDELSSDSGRRKRHHLSPRPPNESKVDTERSTGELLL